MELTRYLQPAQWMRYNQLAILNELVAAKAAVLALTQIPSQRNWAESLQVIQLKREVAGTSRIEGADFTEKELDEALTLTPEQLQTRSQRQAATAVATYRWISSLPNDLPVTAELIRDVHRRLVTGADDDHCAPGTLRGPDQNVTFGTPRHRGAEGGRECSEAFQGLVKAINTVFHGHDPLIQALALHYHFAAIHPFLDGNGRTARALEALMLQRTGLRDTLFIAMSNYYYEEKTAYLTVLNDVGSLGHDLTPFLRFGLRGIEKQCAWLLKEIRMQVKKALFRNVMHDLFGRLQSPRKRVMAKRHIQVLELLLQKGQITGKDIVSMMNAYYINLNNPAKAISRDLNYLLMLNAIVVNPTNPANIVIEPNLDWPTQITETEFFQKVKQMPRPKTSGFIL